MVARMMPSLRHRNRNTVSTIQRLLTGLPFFLSAVYSLSTFPRTWVPLASTVELNPQRPNAIHFKGREFIVYNPNVNKESWVVCDSICPHRLAPLSEGRIDTESGNLECSYHGWAFNATGNCVKIPQATPELQAKQVASCRIQQYPVKVVKNIIWTWPWITEQEAPNDDELSRILQGVGEDCNTYTRELPYSYETLVENIVDPSHVPFAHHGLQGTRDDAIPINLTVSFDKTSTNGFSFDFEDRTRKMARKGKGEFRAPYVIQYNAEYVKSAESDKDPGKFHLTTICAPSRPGWSRIIIFGSNRTATTKPKSPIGLVFRALPLWATHMLSNRFLDSDLVFLHYQERQRDPSLATDGYFMPAPADRCVSAMRKWLKEYNSPAEELPPLELDRKRLFDRWSQHSDKCQHCNAVVVDKLPRWRNLTYATLFASLLAMPKLALPSSILAISCILLLRLYNMIETLIKEGEFRHYLND